LTPNFGKLFLEKKRSADDVESKKNLLINLEVLRHGRTSVMDNGVGVQVGYLLVSCTWDTPGCAMDWFRTGQAGKESNIFIN